MQRFPKRHRISSFEVSELLRKQARARIKEDLYVLLDQKISMPLYGAAYQRGARMLHRRLHRDLV